jgi:Flp pilus assembly protein TadG
MWRIPRLDSLQVGTKLRRLLADSRGIAVVEFAFLLPFLLTLFVSTVELGRYLLLTLKLNHAATTVADLATRERELSVATLDNLFQSVQHITNPFEFGPLGVVIVSGVSEDGGGVRTVSWQQRGAGSLNAGSEVGLPGELPTLPQDFVVGANQTIVVAEVFYRYEDWLFGVISDRVIRQVSYYRPRLGTLTELSAG